ncbi:sigma factor [Streptomyces sp. MB09-01]|uniref:RNA polymerase sigma factor n=1 Tax=Streptomyces sp. MB09-01 TaxID=3028666 RepID=UPI0029B2DBAA|nr:sigma factor [Streptomyces sp. MB09-01]MDX3536194.1 sigma factor [Streptomyces sp. MB09-01]
MLDVDGTPGDRDRLSLLYVIYNARLVRHLRARLGTRWESAEDIAQATWVLVAERVAKCGVTDDEAFGWIAELARAAMLAHMRGTRRETTTDFTSLAAGLLLPTVPSAEEEALANTVVLAMLDQEPTPLEVAA